MSELGLHEEVLLLALLDEDGGVDPRASRWTQAFAAALVLEAAMRGHLKVSVGRGGELRLTNHRPAEDTVLHAVVARMRREEELGTLAWWIHRLEGSGSLRRRTAEGLVSRGVLTSRRRGRLWIFSPKVFPTRDATPEAALRADLLRTTRARRPTDRDAVRWSLLLVGGLVAVALDGVERPPSGDRLRRIARARPLGRLVLASVARLHAAWEESLRRRRITMTIGARRHGTGPLY